MPCDHRERRRVQSHGVPEPELQGRVLLGLPGPVGATWVCLVSQEMHMTLHEMNSSHGICFVDPWVLIHRYNCNRYNEDDAKAARDAQEVIIND